MPTKSIKEISVQYLKGVGPARKKLMAQLGVEMLEDLLYFFPRRYEDRRSLIPISKVQEGETHTICGDIVSIDSHQAWHTTKHVLTLVVSDGSGSLSSVWFNQGYMVQYFKAQQKIILHGKIARYKDSLQMVSPEYEIVDEEEEGESLNVGRIVPIYPLTKGLTQRYLRRIIKGCLRQHIGGVEEVLPFTLREKYRLLNLA